VTSVPCIGRRQRQHLLYPAPSDLVKSSQVEEALFFETTLLSQPKPAHTKEIFQHKVILAMQSQKAT